MHCVIGNACSCAIDLPVMVSDEANISTINRKDSQMDSSGPISTRQIVM